MVSKETISEVIKELETKVKECKKSPNLNEDYSMGLEHAVRFIKKKLNDVISGEKE